MATNILRGIPKDTMRGALLHALAETAGRATVVTPAMVTAGKVERVLSQAPLFATSEVYTSAGVKKAHDGVTAVVGKKVTVDNTGATDFVAGDRVVIRAHYS